MPSLENTGGLFYLSGLLMGCRPQVFFSRQGFIGVLFFFTVFFILPFSNCKPLSAKKGKVGTYILANTYFIPIKTDQDG